MTKEKKKIASDAIGVAAGAVLVAIVFGVWGYFSDGGMIESFGGLTERKLSESQTVAGMQKKLSNIEMNLTSKKRIKFKEKIKVFGEGPRGSWREVTYCPAGSFVCGLSLKVDSPQGAGDDSELNGVALRCCRAFPTKLK